MVLAAAAVAALVGCAKETVSEQASSSGKFVDVKFTAEIPAYQTTKSTVDVNGLTFNTRWADGDKMGIRYQHLAEDSEADGYNLSASYSNGVFSTKLPEYKGIWYYNAYYPYQAADDENAHYVNIPFGAERIQNGNDINSAYDIMCAKYMEFDDAEQGKTDGGKDISFDMVRQTALLYFHLTSQDIDEPLTKATLSVEGDPIAAEAYSMYYSGNNLDTNTYGTAWTTGDSQSITLTFTNAPSSKDFKLWFNILPTVEGLRENGLKNMKLVVETESKTLTLTAPVEELYFPGYISKVEFLDVASTNWKDKETPVPPVTDVLFFYESFDGNSGDGGNDGKWSGITGTPTAIYDIKGWSAKNSYGANACVRFGTGNKLGSITSPALGITSNFATLSFNAAAWNSSSEENTLTLSVSAPATIDVKSVTLTKGVWREYTCVISGADANTTVTLSAAQSSNNRFFLDEVYVYTGTKPSKPEKPSLDVVSPASLILTAQDGTTDAFTVTTNQESWDAVSDNDAFTVNKTETGFTVSAPLNPTLAERKATITVTAGNAEQKTFTVTQSAASFEITSSEVVLKAVAGSSVQRTITSDYNWAASVSADAKFTVSPVEYTYADGGKQVIKFTASEDNSSADGTITLGTVVFSNSVNNEKITVIVKQESSYVAPFITLTPESGSVAADATSASFAVKSNVDWTVSTDAGWVTLGTTSGSNDGTVALSFTANDGTKERVAVIAVSSADGKVSNTYTLTQKFPGSTSTPLMVTYDFTKITGFNDWTSAYAEHVVKYDIADVVFSSANKNSSIITDRPVTKGKPVCVVMSVGKTIKSVKLICKQWGTKSQTITLNTSTDGGTNYTATTTKSSNFTLSASDIADGVNAVKFTFSSTSNQVGISSLELTYTE